MTDVARTAARSYPFSAPDRLQLDPHYAQLRREEPLTRVQLPFGEQAWLATRYADVRTVLGDARFSRAASVGRDEPRLTPRQIGDGILSMDPPEHTRLRRLVAKAFTARRVEQLRPRARQIADELIDAMVAAGPPVDLVEHFATPLPIQVICELLGVPFADRHLFHVWSEAIVSTTSLTPERIQEYLDNLHGYIGELVEQRRREPTDDLLCAMVQARDEQQDRFTEQEIVQLAAGLLAAGHETTVTQLPNFAYVLLTHPDELARLRAEPELLPTAIEELMRFVPLGVASSFARYATEDIEVGGVLVRAGEPVIGSLSSANRDETVFTDPDRLDLGRETNPHIGFGHGVHHCLGAQLARMELQVGIGTLVARLPGLRIAVPESELTWKSGIIVRGLARMPVAW
ncbi:cytochrome P450 [Micromonospora endophytica]|uniref:Cytochrome P450 n=1 Tax=Micromonospora endophytica TaxID=515350 RepID=A0A2W2CJX7_9ACTN|nr:cytochrome P450 [Micromonospora endophytica]PZF98782.1 cytochrome P450 [Micromonospora endophytica]RIW43393.1 cytochrome P450 [Micromonospora endophytica]